MRKMEKLFSHILIAASAGIVISVLFCGCSTAVKPVLDRTEVEQLIISNKSDRSSRYRAIETASAKYTEDFTDWLGAGLVNLPDEEIAEKYIELLSKDSKSVPYLCQYAYKRPAKHKQIQVICEQLSGEKYPQYLFKILNHPTDGKDMLALADLWEYLCRYSDGSLAAKWLDSITPKNKLIETIVFYWKEFGYIPANNGELIQCHLLKNDISAESAIIKAKINSLSDKNYSLKISDYGLLRAINTNTTTKTRDELTEAITGYINNSNHISRPADYSGALNDIDDVFANQVNSLSITDLLRLYMICDTVFADNFDKTNIIDNKNKFSENGGLCFIDNNGKLCFKNYTPRRTEGEHKYIESREALNDSPTATARWHVHDQRNSGRNLAGPGNDDMVFAKKVGTDIVIFTIVNNTGIVNIDLVTSNGKVIDIGCIP